MTKTTPRDRFASKMGQMGLAKGLDPKAAAPAPKKGKKKAKKGKMLKNFKAGYSSK